MSLLKYFESPASGIVVVSLGYGDLLLESIREVARRTETHSGTVVAGLGSLSRARIHTVVTNTLPAKNEFFDLDGPLEVVNFSGVIAGYEPHVHITMVDASGRFYGGHLEEGCSILTQGAFSIHRLPDVKLTRRARGNSVTQLVDLE